jgi:hypothetical protein
MVWVDLPGWAERVTVVKVIIVNNPATIPSKSVRFICSSFHRAT